MISQLHQRDIFLTIEETIEEIIEVGKDERFFIISSAVIRYLNDIQKLGVPLWWDITEHTDTHIKFELGLDPKDNPENLTFAYNINRIFH